MMDQAVTELTNKLTDLAAHYGPAVADATRAAVRVSGMGSIATGVVLLLVALILQRVGASCWRGVAPDNDQEIPAFLAWVVAVGACIFGTAMLLDVWAWTALFAPDVYLVHKALGL